MILNAASVVTLRQKLFLDGETGELQRVLNWHSFCLQIKWILKERVGVNYERNSTLPNQ